MSKSILAAAVLLAVSVAGSAARADVILNPTARGHYDMNGIHHAGDNYIAGTDTSVTPNNTYHDFFTYNLSGVTGTVISASLVLYNPPGGANGSGTFTLYDVSTDATTLNTERIAGGTPPNNPSIPIYTDLGSGNTYGSLAYTTSDNGQFLTISLDSQFLSDINNRTGNSFSIGGATDSGTFLYGSSGSGNLNDGLTKLDLVIAAPLPSTLAGFAALGAVIGVVKFAKPRRETRFDLEPLT